MYTCNHSDSCTKYTLNHEDGCYGAGSCGDGHCGKTIVLMGAVGLGVKEEVIVMMDMQGKSALFHYF